MKITEAKLRNIIAKTIKESVFEQGMQQNPFSDLDNKAREKAVEIEIEIEALQNKSNALTSLGTICRNVDKQIKEQYQGIQGPVKEDYFYVYNFAQPIQYNEEYNRYGNIEEGFEYDIKDLFPDEIKDAVSVYSKENNGFLYGFKLSIDIDDINGWY